MLGRHNLGKNEEMSDGKATPKEMRQAIVRAFLEEGPTHVQISRLVGVAQATVSRVLRFY
jgi:transposase-like protein